MPGLNENLFSVMRALQKGLQVLSGGEALILNKNSTVISFDRKMANTGDKDFLLTTKL